MKTIKTSELTGAALDWAVAEAVFGKSPGAVPEDECGHWYAGFGDGGVKDYSPSTDWSQGGPLIEEHDVSLAPDGEWEALAPFAKHGTEVAEAVGPTPLIATCRAIVAAKMGFEVDVPEELV